ncbi:DUF3219 family protein [Natribacillus halophilus]|uniref:DUF3219 domain-containing protein n=1 Tax=Natribacillus halophilus TaxID=549003 RepID=A0A1G8M7C8_9BACI|nr:DUF3219 family protein [Natribacillus halophilus]SDI63795.1 Protein of unknown function [Natribacillus halophilus]
MVNEVLLNNYPIKVESYDEEENVDGLYKITIEFKVTSTEYHDITTLLYEGTFDIKVPERDLAFRGTIQQYFTSITNLYIEGQVGDYTLSLIEVNS